jgi:hypothetical protein
VCSLLLAFDWSTPRGSRLRKIGVTGDAVLTYRRAVWRDEPPTQCVRPLSPGAQEQFRRRAPPRMRGTRAPLLGRAGISKRSRHP